MATGTEGDGSGRGIGADFCSINKCGAAARQGHADAQFHLAMHYNRGQGVVQDYKESVKWCYDPHRFRRFDSTYLR